jgi:hypothetical protein
MEFASTNSISNSFLAIHTSVAFLVAVCISCSFSPIVCPFTPALHHHPSLLQYDAMGKRTNTRTYRLRERLIHQRHDWCVHAAIIIAYLPMGFIIVFSASKEKLIPV